MSRTFAVDVLACPKCHGRMRLLGTSAPGYQLVDDAKYPGIVADSERTFARLAAERAAAGR
jgi:hypothetical protein